LRESILKQKTKGFDEFIIEGSQLNLKGIRDMVVSCVGINRLVQMVFIPEYENWIKNMNKKNGHNIEIQKWDEWKKIYYKQIASIQFPSYFYLFNSIDSVCVEHNEYQRIGFTDEKYKLLQLPERLEGLSVLDLGCNSGMIGVFLKNHGCGNYLGLDFNWRHIEDCVSLEVSAAKFNLNNFAEDWKERYDITLCLAAIHYIENKELFIKKISEITNKYFVLEIPVYNGGNTNLIKQETIELYLSKYFKYWDCLGKSVSPTYQEEYSKRLIYKAYVKQT
jgi:SAM-dependent methyltransferase